MRALSISPKLDVRPDRLNGRTPWVVRALWLFSYDRRVTVDRARRQVSVTTRRFWIWRNRRVIPFDRIDRIILRAQELPGFGLFGFLTLWMAPGATSAFILIALGLAEGKDEFLLFTIWEVEPDDPAWLEALTAASAGDGASVDEGMQSIVRLLQEYLAVPVSSH
jgi:hypothetical protein